MGQTAQSFCMLARHFHKGERPLFISVDSETYTATEQTALSQQAEETFY